jgi:hypothetical protein
MPYASCTAQRTPLRCVVTARGCSRDSLLSYRLAFPHRAYVLSYLTRMHERQLIPGMPLFSQLRLCFFVSGFGHARRALTLYVLLNHVCSMGCLCTFWQLEHAGHALIKPLPHQRLLPELHLLWTVQTPVLLPRARASLHAKRGRHCAQG